LARETVRVIYQNVILFAFAANFLGVVLTAWILPTWSDAWRQRAPVAAALFHQIGSLLVLLNAMRLIWFERWQTSWLSKLESAITHIATVPWTQTESARGTLVRAWQLRGALARLAVFAALLAYFTQVVVFVQPDEVAIVKRFGRVQAVLPPGPHLRLPPPFDIVMREQPRRARTLEIGWQRSPVTSRGANAIEWNSPHAVAASQDSQEEPLWMTGDRSLLELAVTIQYRLSDVKAFRFATREPERLLEAMAESVVREVVASQPLLASTSSSLADTELLSLGRSVLEVKIAQRLQQRTAALGLGVEILTSGVCVQDVHPPLQVVDAFRDVSTAFKERERMKNEGESYRRDKLIQAAGETVWSELSTQAGGLSPEQWTSLRPELAGEAFVEITAAESFAQDRQAAAVGDAAAFTKEQVAQAAAPQLAQWRLFMDTIGTALANKPKILLDRTSAGRRHLFLNFPRDKSPPLMQLPERTNPDE
jgi:regulator of protease activity HflC (stomatin/prohibitin superfamily)